MPDFARLSEGEKRIEKLSKLTLILNNNKREVMLSTSNEDDLYKHGMKPYVRWGALIETLAASCIL